MPFPHSPLFQGRIPALDGLRGLAILLVFWHHTLRFTEDQVGALARFPFGWVGVDLFFVLSGFLITGILLDTRNGPNFLRNFFVRRALRILPLYYGALSIALVLVSMIELPGHLRWPVNDQLFYWTYIQNWTSVISLFWRPISVGPLGHFWSLAIEEQFYICWPFIVYRATPKGIMVWCVVLGLLSMIGRYLIILLPHGVNHAYFITVTRLDGLVIGAFIAAYLYGGYSVVAIRRCIWPAIILSVAALIAIGIRDDGFRYWQDRCWTLKFGPSVLAVLFGAVLLSTVLSCGPKWISAVCCNRCLRIAGQYSYCMYVVHMPIADFLAPEVTDWAGLVRGGIGAGIVALIITLGMSLGIAIVSWRYFEGPCLRLRRYFQLPRVEVGSSLVHAKSESRNQSSG